MRLLCLGVGLLLLSGCDRPKPMPDEENAVTAFALQRFVDADEISGAVTGVIGPDGLIAVEAFGLADIGQKSPMRKDALFWVGEMSRPMTAVALMMLVEEGKVRLEDPLEKYVPAFKDVKVQTPLGPVAPRRPITLRDLLAHTSGIHPAAATAPGAAIDTLTLAAMADKYASRPLTHEPGAQAVDSDNDSHLLGRVIEVASGRPFAEFMQEQLFYPLGMEDTTFWPDPDQLDLLAKPYARDQANGGLVEVRTQPFTLPLHASERTALPGVGLYSNVRDLGRFAQMLVQNGQLNGRRYLKPATLKQMIAATPGGRTVAGLTEGTRYGLGWQVVAEPKESDGALSPGAYGQSGSYGTQLWIDPVKRRAYLLLIQRGDAAQPVGGEIRKEFLQAVAEAYGR